MREPGGVEPAGETGAEAPTPEQERRARRAGRRLLLFLGALVLGAVVGVAALTLARERRESVQRDRLAQAAERGPSVLVAAAATPAARRTVTLPGDVRPLWQSTLMPR